ncbi:MAG: O-unit flippase [Clostridium sartagoforme]|nr:O-unit flippase [Clostridium sartagoforme]
MRTKKASINIVVNILTYIIALIPSFIIRKVFLDNLGSELLGLSSLFNNIIGLLSLVELGIGTAIVFSLYKPFAENDRAKVKGYLDYYHKFYTGVAGIVFVLGIIIIPFLRFFTKGEVDLRETSIYFLLYLVNTVISYLFSYKLCLLNVAQEGYKVSLATAISKVIISILQIVFMKMYPSFYIYLIIQIVIQLIYFIVLNKYIDIKNPWLKTTKGIIKLEEKNSLKKNIKALFLHKIGSFIVFSTDNLLISAFINLTTVTIYNSYNMIIGAMQNLLNSGLSGITASIGNLLVEKDEKSAFEVHKKLFLLSFWVVSMIVITLSNTLHQFIAIWMGQDQLIDNLTLIIILINLYFSLMRSVVEKFQEGSGNYYQDRYASLIESAINLVASLILVKIMGLPGIFLGTLLSNILVVFWVKPVVVYKYVFKENVKFYFITYFKYICILLIPLFVCNLVTSKIQTNYNIISFLFNGLLNIVVINLIYLLIFRKNKEFLFFKNTIMKILLKK